MKDAHQLSVSEIVSAVHGGELGVVELVSALLERIARLEPKLDVWAALDSAGALEQAADLDRSLARGERRALHGVPVGIKDIIDVAGLPTVAGFAPFQGLVAQRDAAIVARLRALGAVIVGKTHTTQFASGDPAPTRNPWHPLRTPGGSSAGSGAGVAAGMVPAALGTQTAGSVLRPAAYCGVVGFKPSFDWFSRDGVLPLAWSLDHLGLLVRTVADAGLLHRTLVGDVTQPATLQRPRIGLLTDCLERSSPVVAEHLSDLANRLVGAGAQVDEIRLPVTLDLMLAVQGLIVNGEIAALHAGSLARQPDAYGPRIRLQIEVGQLIPASYDLQARRVRRRIAHQIDRLFDAYDVLMLPTATDLPPGRETTGDRSFQAPWTLLGTPAISLPTGVSGAGVPLAAQLVGRRGDDARLLGWAGWCADRLGLIDLPDLDDPGVSDSVAEGAS